MQNGKFKFNIFETFTGLQLSYFNMASITEEISSSYLIVG